MVLERVVKQRMQLLYDFSKAFDLVDHEIQIQKLQFYGIRGSGLNLFKNFLSNRKQYVE